MNSFDIIVIALSIILGILLIASIVLVVGVIKLVKKVREIIAKADDIMEDVESVSSFFKKTAGPVAITGLIGNIVSKVAEIKGKKGSK